MFIDREIYVSKAPLYQQEGTMSSSLGWWKLNLVAHQHDDSTWNTWRAKTGPYTYKKGVMDAVEKVIMIFYYDSAV